MFTLIAGNARAEVSPEMGAGVASLSAGGKQVLRNWSGKVSDGPFALAMNLLVPFSNRISGGFSHDGVYYALQPNHSGEPFIIHGDGFQKPWKVVGCGTDWATLLLAHGGIGPWHYSAEVTYRLTATQFLSNLSITSKADVPLPFGLGFHPWFPRDTQTQLEFDATSRWEVGNTHLPTATVPTPIPPEIEFSTMKPLPENWINTAYAGWDGKARITQNGDAVSLTVLTDNLDTALVYSPSKDADFFCFEPISHPTDAHNLPGKPGLVTLSQGETMTATMGLAWTEQLAQSRPAIDCVATVR